MSKENKDPAFLFYPGDYLRDTQMLSSETQVAYDRIMCEHIRNICITQGQLKFLTKRLDEDQKEELMNLLVQVNGGYQIEWVAQSITKRRAYSESRRKNRTSKKEEDVNKTSKTHDSHMENEIENENISVNDFEEEIKSIISEQTIIDVCRFIKLEQNQVEVLRENFILTFNDTPGEVMTNTTGQIRQHFKNWCRNNHRKFDLSAPTTKAKILTMKDVDQW